MINLQQDTTTIDYSNGNYYYSYEYYNLNKIKYNLIKKYILKNNFINFNKFFLNTKYFHFSIQENKLVFYYRLLDLNRVYILIGLDISNIGKLKSFKFYFINRNNNKIKAIKLDKNFITKISSKFIFKTKNINIIYRDSNNIYFSFEKDANKLISKKGKIKRIIKKIIKKNGR